MRNEIPLTDEQIEAVFSELGYGLTVDDLVFTADTIDDFISARDKYWSDPGYNAERRIEQGFNAWSVSSAQARKGQPRKDVVVVDFGSVRAVHS